MYTLSSSDCSVCKRILLAALAFQQRVVNGLPDRIWHCSWARQFQVLLKRSIVSQLRNPTDTACRLLLASWIGLVAGKVLYNLITSSYNYIPVSIESLHLEFAHACR